MAHRILTLITDYGLSDGTVGAIKGVILKLAPETILVDLCHGLPPHDVFEAAWALAQAYGYYPAGTIHLVGLDAEGAATRGLLVEAGDYVFLAPDNGVLSLVLKQQPLATVRALTARHYMLGDASPTFQARDVLAPIAAWLTRGVAAEKMGEVVTDYRQFALPQPKQEGGKLSGVVLRADRFGNLITNLTRAHLPALAAAAGAQVTFTLNVGPQEVHGLYPSYGEAPAGAPFAVWGADGWLEISVARGSAARTLNAQRGTPVSCPVA